jgi:hypothetical protein
MAQQVTQIMDKGMKHTLQAELFALYRNEQYHSLGFITALSTMTYGKNDNKVENDDTEKFDTDDNSRPLLPTYSTSLTHYGFQTFHASLYGS